MNPQFAPERFVRELLFLTDGDAKVPRDLNRVFLLGSCRLFASEELLLYCPALMLFDSLAIWGYKDL